MEARVDESSGELTSATKLMAIDEIDPSSDDFPNNPVRLDEVETTQLVSKIASSPQMATISKYKTGEIGCSKMLEPRFDVCVHQWTQWTH